MQISNLPAKLALPFANSGTKNNIPVNSQVGITPGAASLEDGFPPLTMTPLAAGGIPPSGQDFNGILFGISGHTRWASAGGQYPFDADFSAAVGGYPKYATIQKVDGTGYWMSLVDNNVINPEVAGAGWVDSNLMTYALDTGAANAYAVSYTPALTAIPDGLVVSFKAKTLNTGASTLAINGIAPAPIVGGAYSPLQGGEIVVNGDVRVQWNSSLDAWVLLDCAGGALQVPSATAGKHALNQDAADARYALLNSISPAGLEGTFYGPVANIPPGWIAMPIASTNISRTTFARLFAAVGTTWGAGDGATTFGMPWCPADQTSVAANGNVGTTTSGVVISHLHGVAITTGIESTTHSHAVGDGGHGHTTPVPVNGELGGSGTTGPLFGSGSANSPSSLNVTGITLGGQSTNHQHNVSGNTGNTGGGANLSAGVRAIKVIKI